MGRPGVEMRDALCHFWHQDFCANASTVSRERAARDAGVHAGLVEIEQRRVIERGLLRVAVARA